MRKTETEVEQTRERERLTNCERRKEWSGQKKLIIEKENEQTMERDVS